MDKLLLDTDFPDYVSDIVMVFEQTEIFDKFNENLPSGKRTWWGQGQPGIYRRCQRHRPTVLQPHDYGRAV